MPMRTITQENPPSASHLLVEEHTGDEEWILTAILKLWPLKANRKIIFKKVDCQNVFKSYITLNFHR